MAVGIVADRGGSRNDVLDWSDALDRLESCSVHDLVLGSFLVLVSRQGCGPWFVELWWYGLRDFGWD